MATYHVKKTGNDSTGDGSSGNPWLTITHGISQMSGGDTLTIWAGTYVENVYNPPNGISNVSRTIIKANTGDTVTIKPTGGAQGACVGVQFNHYYITFDGLTIDGTNAGAIDGITICDNSHAGSTCHDITIQNCIIQNGPGGGSGGGGITFRTNTNSFAYNIFVLNNTIQNWAMTAGTSLDHGLYLDATDSLIEGNIIKNNYGHGMQQFSAYVGLDNNIIRNNKFFNNGSYGIGIYKGANTQVYNNLVYNNGLRIGGTGGIRVGFSSSNTKIYNNTVYGNTGYGIRVESGISGVVIKNNICYGNTSTAISNSGTNTTGGTNLCNATGGLCTVAGDPKFTNASSGDFRLNTGSPALDIGANLSATFTTDYTGATRPNSGSWGWDLGAYEYGGSTPSVGSTYYVATTGNDSTGNGSSGNPWLTIAKGLSMMSGGDTLIIKNGSYAEGINRNAIPSGISDTHRTIIKADTGATVTLTGKNTDNRTISIFDRSYITLDGINVYHGQVFFGSASSTGLPGSHYITMKNAVIDGADTSQPVGSRSVVGFAGVSGSPHTHILYQNVEIKNAPIGNPDGSLSGNGLYTSGMANSIVENCYIHDNYSKGIQQSNSAGNNICSNNIYRNNRLINNGSHGVLLANGSNNLFYNNIVANNCQLISGSSGIAIQYGTISGNKIYNNTIYNNNGVAIYNATGTGAIIKNNILWKNANNTVVDSVGDATISNNLTIDPLFNSPGTLDFTLKSGSPAIDTGASLSTVFTTDFLGVTRPQGSAWDIGAYERVSGGAPPSSSGTYYVTKTGSDANAGTVDAPFLTIGHALGVMAAGNTLWVGEGIYAESIDSTIPSGTSDSVRTTVKGNEGELVILRPATGTVSNNDVITLTNKNYITLKNLTIDGESVSQNCIRLTSSGSNGHHITFDTLEIKKAPHNGILVTNTNNNNIIIKNCIIHDTGTTTSDHSINIATASNTIQNNVIYNSSGSGISITSASQDLSSNIIKANKIYNTEDVGIIVGGSGSPNSNILIYNNILYDTGLTQNGGIDLASTTDAVGVYQNTLYNIRPASFSIRVSSGSTNAKVINNIAYLCGTYTNNGPSTTASNNLFGVDPLFVNATNRDFHIMPNSPAIGTGYDLSSIVIDDYEGGNRK